MDVTEANALLGFSLDYEKMSLSIKKLEPENWGKEIYARPKYLSGHICESLKSSGEQ
jgi:hypothetical protein